MKKRLLALSIIVVICMALCACGKNGNKLVAEESVITLDAGQTHTVELKKGNAEDIEWSSADEAVAAVSEDGTVTGKKAGITVVTGRVKDSFVQVGVVVKDKKYVSKDGTVYEESDIVSIEVGVKHGGKNDVTIKKGDKYTLVAYTDPEDSKDKITWKSDNTSAVTVNANGEISAVGKGMANIEATAPNGVKGVMIIRVN